LWEVETYENNHVTAPKLQNARGRAKTETPTSTQNAVATALKKTNNNKETKTTSYGSVPANSRVKQPVGKTRSFNDGEVTNSKLGKTVKPTPVSNNPLMTKVDAFVVSYIMFLMHPMLLCSRFFL